MDERTNAGVSRRSFLQAGGATALGLSLTSASASVAPTALAKSEPRSAIVLNLVGGPSQLETWDPKPDAPAEVRSPHAAIRTSVPGVFVSGNFPLMAQRMHRIALVRSLHHTSAATHEVGSQLMMTGKRSTGEYAAPHLGAVLSHLYGRKSELPANVIIPWPIGNTGVAESHGQEAGFLGADHEPFFPGRSSASLQDPHDEGAIRQRRALRRALDLDQESPSLRDRYGRNPFGEACLRARRLIERGVRMCTVNQFSTVFDCVTWDMHANGGSLNTTLADYRETVCPQFDRAFAALLDDLDERGLLAETVVSVVSEMGRSPWFNNRGGRDHWAGVWTNFMAGGPVAGGTVVGSSDAHGALPVSRPVSPAEYCATLYHALGVPLEQAALLGPDGRSRPLVDASPVHELFA